MKSKITILDQGFARYSSEIANSLAKEGYGVLQYTGLFDKEDKFGERIVGLEFKRLCPYIRKGLILRATTRFIYVLLASLHILFFRRRGVVLLTTNPGMNLMIGYLLKKIRGQKYVAIVYDVYPDTLASVGVISKDNPLYRIVDRLYARALSNANSVVVLGTMMQEVVESKIQQFGNSKIDVNIIRNWADTDFIKPLTKEENKFCREHDLVDKFVVSYSGNIGMSHDLETVVRAAIELQDKEDIRFLIIGNGKKKEKLERMVAEYELDNVKMLPFQPESELPYSLTAGDTSIVTLAADQEGLSVPQKLYTSMAGGQAIIALASEKSEVSQSVLNNNCGFHVSPGDVEAFSQSVMEAYKDEELLSSMQRNARKTVEEKYNKENQIRKYKELVQKVEKPA